MLEQIKKDPILYVVNIFILFMIFSFVGWSYEIINDAIVQGGFHWRASLAGPWCPIYGIGGLIIIAVLQHFAYNDITKKETTLNKTSSIPSWIIRILVTSLEIYVIVTIVELAGSYIIEATMGYLPWDYSTSWGNFEGRIAPVFTMRFVIGGLVFLYVIKPCVLKWSGKHRHLAINIALGLLILFVVDNVLETIGVWSDVLPRETEVFVLPE